MSATWKGQTLLEPISVEQPCGENLEDSPVLSTFAAHRLFGQSRSPEAPPEPAAAQGDGHPREVEKVRPPIEWDGLRTEALDTLSKSKDLRLLAYLGAALLRTDGLPAFAQVLTVAAHWLESYWSEVYPLVDEDAITRRNALNCFADPMAVVDRVWRLPLVSSRQHGRFSLRDFDLAAGQAVPAANEKLPDEAAIRAAFRELPIEELTALEGSAVSATAALNSIDTKMRGEGGPEVAPDFGPLLTQFAKLTRILRERLAERTGGSGNAIAPDGGNGTTATTTYTGGAITSRQEAVRALDAVADFFRRNEPSSPIPLFVDRAKRLVAKDFLEVLEDIAPDALAGARSAGGLKPDQ
jgi:type VI secretion system protein ImpA